MHPVCSRTSISRCYLDSNDRVAAAMVLMLWDHCLMLGEEIAIMWGPQNGRILTKVVHVLNRYLTETVSMYRLYGP